MFRPHIQAARASGLPLIVHTRDADRDTADLLRAGHGRGAVHRRDPLLQLERRSSASPRSRWACISGIGGILTFKKSEQLRATVRELPLERLLLETDAPYLAPEPFRGKRNEPAYVAHVAATLAEVKGVPLAEIESGDDATTSFACSPRRSGPPPRPCG